MPPVGAPYPLAVDYQLMDVVSGEECGEGAAVFGLLQAAKYKALEASKGADNLMMVRVRTQVEGQRTCVRVTGRAYRVKALQSVPPQTEAGK